MRTLDSSIGDLRTGIAGVICLSDLKQKAASWCQPRASEQMLTVLSLVADCLFRIAVFSQMEAFQLANREIRLEEGLFAGEYDEAARLSLHKDGLSK